MVDDSTATRSAVELAAGHPRHAKCRAASCSSSTSTASTG